MECQDITACWLKPSFCITPGPALLTVIKLMIRRLSRSGVSCSASTLHIHTHWLTHTERVAAIIRTKLYILQGLEIGFLTLCDNLCVEDRAIVRREEKVLTEVAVRGLVSGRREAGGVIRLYWYENSCCNPAAETF